MPSKKYNGNTPLGSLRLGSLSDVELEVAKRTPKQAMTTGVVQTHNGSFHTPKRRQRATKANTPWKVSITKDKDGVYKATINEGVIYEGLLDLSKMVFEIEGAGAEEKTKGQGSVVVGNDVVCILYTYEEGDTPAKLEFSVFPSGVDFAEWEYKDENEEEPPEIVATRYPLAKILDTGETDAENNPILQTEQIASNNLALVSICKNGEGILSFTPF
jgi:hypothetical protein